MTAATTQVRPFLLFEGRAEEAIRFYLAQFEDGRLIELHHYGPGEAGKEGSVQRAVFSIAGLTVMAIDSPIAHGFTFTPAISLFVSCNSEEQIERLTAVFSEAGNTFMPLGDYGFSRRFAWVSDRFGVSWQLNLE